MPASSSVLTSMPKFAIVLVYLISLAVRSAGQCSSADTAEFDWPSLPASQTLSWTDCYTGGLQCARLEVPLDYSGKTSGTAAIALTRLPSPLDQDSSGYLGPLLLNPGGPGSSGVSILTTGALSVADLRARMGDGYDIVGFDPRGIGRSTPVVERFPPVSQFDNIALSEVLAALETPALDEPGAIGRTVATAELINSIIGDIGSSYLPFINTEFTARDMMQIVKAYGFEKLNYYGVSYGTVIGAIFATIFPDNVGRMVLDGVIDVEAWFSGNGSAALVDTDKAIDVFFQSCFEAGPNRCAFYDTSPEKISANLDALFDQVRTQPALAISPNGFGLVDYTLLRSVLFNSSGFPYLAYPSLAEGLAQLSAGNGSLILQSQNLNPFSCGLNDTDVSYTPGAAIAIWCNDVDVQNKTLAEWQAYYEEGAQTSVYADIWLYNWFQCQGWPVSTKSSVRAWGGNTSTPILFVGNTADSHTPLVGAEKMSSVFPGSVVLTQNSTGHTSIYAPSNCTVTTIEQYLGNGTLPQAGTVCQVDVDISAVY